MDNGTITIVRDILAYVSLVAGSVLILKSKVKTDNLKDLKERVEILEKERQYQQEQHVQNQKAISNLEGQLQTYKEIPLKSIASSLEAINTSNSVILEALGSNKDVGEGLLVHTSEANPLDVKVKR